VFVYGTEDRVRRLDFECAPWSSPDTYPGVIVEADQEAALLASGLTVLRPLQYMVAMLRQEIRRRAPLLVHVCVLNYLRFRLARELVDAASAVAPFWKVTAALRELVRDRVSCRDLNAILEHVVDFSFASHATNRWCIGDGRVAARNTTTLSDDLVSFLRTALAPQIAWAASRRTGTVVAYLLDESRLTTHAAADEAQVISTMNALIRAVEEKLDRGGEGAASCLVVSDDTAKRIRRTFRLRFPRLAVLSYADLPSDVNINLEDRIDW